MISNKTTKNALSSMGMTLEAASTTYPIAYTDNIWQVGIADSDLATFMGGAGSYSVEEVINKVITTSNSAGLPVEVVASTSDVTTPTTNKLYLVYTTSDANVLIEKYIYNGTAFTKVGTFTLDTTNFVKKSGTYEDGYITSTSGTNGVAQTSISKADLENVMKEYKGTNATGLPAVNDIQDGTLADLLYQFRANDNELGGGSADIDIASEDTAGIIKLGFAQSDADKDYPVKVDDDGMAYVHVPWAGNETMASATADGLMSKEQYTQVALYNTVLSATVETTLVSTIAGVLSAGTKAFFAPLAIAPSNCFGISTGHTTSYILAHIFKTSSLDSSTAFEMTFNMGNYSFRAVYNGNTSNTFSSLYYEEYAVSETPSEDTTFPV